MSATIAATAVGTVTTREDLGTGESAAFRFWTGQDAIAEKTEADWRKRAQRVIDRYRDNRKDASNTAAAQTHRYNILWSNVQTLAPVLYSRTPKASVQRRFLDKDPTGRLASLLLERCIDYSLESFDFDSVMNAVVLDRLLPGRGVCRVLYTPTYGDPIEDDPSEQYEETQAPYATAANEGDAQPNMPAPGAATPSDPLALKASTAPEAPLREVVGEEVTAAYVFWGDYREAPARTWAEMPWLRFQVYMTRDELKDRFGAKGSRVNLDYTPPGTVGPRGDDKGPPEDIFKKARVWEIWDKTKRQVVWIAPGTPDMVLDQVDDPLGLPDFFPMPPPLLATTTNETRVPVPDYVEYQDQAEELDTLTARIDRLTRALKVAGIYPGSEKAALQQLIGGNQENFLVPVEDWAAFATKGGLGEMIQWLPIQQIAQTLINLCDMRDRSKAIIYEITGIGDIIRGASEPTETAAAQKLKASFATRRQEPEQKRVARFARDVIRVMGAIIAEHFSGEQISRMTGYPELEPVPDLPMAPPAMIPAPMGMPQQAPQQGMVG